MEHLPNSATLNARSLLSAATMLAARDRGLASILAAHGPPPLWARKPGFATLVRIILEQQVSLVSARAMFARLSLNIEPFAPERFVELGEGYLRSLGVTRQKAAYCLDLARAEGEGRLKRLSRIDDAAARALLMSVKGIGPWTADIYLLMALRRPDIWPVGDIALASAVMKIKKLESRPGNEELARMARKWRPFRSVAARMCWQFYLSERNSL